MSMKKTIFIDIDGCLIKHDGNLTHQITNEMELLPGVLEKFNEWEINGHKIILITGRKESTRKLTEDGLTKLGIFYDILIMGLNRGERVIINDKKPNNDMSVARAIELERNVGLKNIDVE